MITGAIMFAFVTMHLLNHALLMVSEATAEQALRYFKLVWRNPLGALLLYGSFAVHFILALRTLYLKRYFGLRPLSMVQIIFGLSLPILIAQHVIAARMPVMFNGADSDYLAVIRAMWSNNGLLGVKMATAVIVAWMHGCIGIYMAVSYRDWFPRVAPFLFTAAVIVPTLAFSGVFVTGQRLEPRDASSIEKQMAPPDDFGDTRADSALDYDLERIERRFYIFLAVGFGLVATLRGIRKMRGKETEVVISYAHGEQVRVPRGTTILEASRIGHTNHYSVCGGKGRCSTCRVRIIKSSGPLPPPGPQEQATLGRIQASSDTRLSCQLRPDYDIAVALQLEPPVGGDRLSGPNVLEVGREKEILVMFADLRNFTTISENRLPYDIVFLLNSYFSIVVQAVELAGGRVDKYLGDGVMALFGLDKHEPSEVCRHALGAAAKIVAETQQLNRQLQQEFGIDLEVARPSLRVGGCRRRRLWQSGDAYGYRRHGKRGKPAGECCQTVQRCSGGLGNCDAAGQRAA